MIFMSDRSAEQRHDAVPHDLVDRALVAVNRIHHQLEDRVKDLPGLLGVLVGEQLHRPFEVREQHGDQLAFSLKRRFGCQDLFGEVPRGVAIRRPRRNPRSGGNRMSAGMAELGRRRESYPAVRARPGQRGRALFAEPCPLRVVVLTSRASHCRASSKPAGRRATVARAWRPRQ